MASLAGVLAGRISDAVFHHTGSRKPMLWAGLVVIGASYFLFAFAATLTGLLVAVIILQFGINLVLGGLNALFAVHVPSHDKARLASMVNLCLPIANLGLVLFGEGGEHAMGGGLFLIGVLMALMFVPIFIWSGQRHGPTPGRGDRPAHTVYSARPVAVIWMAVFGARFFIQLSAALLFTFVQPYLSAVLGTSAASHTLKSMVILAAILSLPVAIGAAQLAAWRVNPLRVLQGAALILSVALTMMTFVTSATIIMASYATFMAGLVTYLAVDTAVVAQWLAGSPVVATRLGMMNLANTLPGIIIPAFLLAAGGTAAQGLSHAFGLTAAGAAIAVILLAYALRCLGRP